MQWLSLFRTPFIPAKCDALPAARSSYFREGALHANSCLRSNDYWYEVQTTIGLLLE